MRATWLPLLLAATALVYADGARAPRAADAAVPKAQVAGQAPLPDRHQIETILVTARGATGPSPVSETHNTLLPGEILRLDAASGADILRRLPSVHVPTNSRGESIVFLRNAGERQVAQFLEGMLLNVPWDNRFDMSLLPGSIVGTVLTAAGPLSPYYGVNALGALNILPLDEDGARLRAVAEYGVEDFQRYEGLAGWRTGAMQFQLAAGHTRQDGEALSDNANAPFFQPAMGPRTNTDREITNVLGRTALDFARGHIAATLLYTDSEKGIAPESDRDTSAVRFWRYPAVRLIQSGLHGDMELGDNASFVAAAWVQDFRQTIDQYSDVAYTTINARETDKDRTYGSRGMLLNRLRGGGSLSLSYNVLVSTHKQRDAQLNAGVPGFAPWFVYRQRAVSLGADLEYVLTENVVGELSGGMDWMSYTRTGDKPPMGDFIEPTARAGLAWSPAGPWRLRTSVGYKVRMPTMREVFGVALNRFLLNPDLLPERVISVEGGVEWRRANTAVALIPFAQFVSKTIDQRAVGPLRQRINLRGSRVYGLEVSARTQLADAWFLAGNVTASRVRRLRSSAAEPVYIAEKPAVLAAVSLDYENPGGIEANIEVSHTGRAYSLNAAGAFEALKISTQLNGRLAFNLERAIPWLPPTQIYIRADNLNDAWVEPQLGLPAPGRSVRGGLRVVW